MRGGRCPADEEEHCYGRAGLEPERDRLVGRLCPLVNSRDAVALYIDLRRTKGNGRQRSRCIKRNDSQSHSATER